MPTAVVVPPGPTRASVTTDVPPLGDDPVPGTGGSPNLRNLIGTGDTVLTPLRST